MAAPIRPLERDPEAPIRTRRFIEQAADILDSLIQQGIISQVAGSGQPKWTINGNNIINLISGGAGMVLADPEPGERGWPGPPGIAGATGATGAAGADGRMGPPGQDGQEGDSSNGRPAPAGDWAYRNLANTFYTDNTFNLSPNAPANGTTESVRMGQSAGNSTMSGSWNCIFGALAGQALTSGDGNVIIGQRAVISNFTTQRFSVVIGTTSTYSNSGNGGFDVIIGANTSRAAGGGITGATAIGYGQTIAGDSNVSIGRGVTNTVNKSVAIGNNANVTAESSVIVGDTITVSHLGCVHLGGFGTSDRNGDFKFCQAAVSTAYFSVGLDSSTTHDRKAYLQKFEWISNTDASRKARVRFFAGDANGSDGGTSGDGFEFLRADADGTRTNPTIPAGLTSNNARARLGGTIFDHAADASTTHTDGTEDDLYSDTTVSSTFAENNDKLEADYAGKVIGHATATRKIKVYFAGTAILDTTALTSAADSFWVIQVKLIRVSATVVRYWVLFTDSGLSAIVPPAVGELTGLTLSTTNILKITGAAAGVGAAAADIIAKMGSVDWKGAA